ncbi:MAG TPA: lipid A biosynthesis lauroyl acyltransferase [Xanthobacteraceae bacterium]|nr:lipid A biosynthesis lauroyl acyltransferase [Xanthobacteraceae bacterium]
MSIAVHGFRRTVRKTWRRIYRPLLRPVLVAIDYVLVIVVRIAVRGLKKLDPDASSDFMGKFVRSVGPFVPANKTGLANLRAAYPEKSEAEIKEILGGVWENLGRVAGEFVHLEGLWDYDYSRPTPGRIETSDALKFGEMRDDGKPALIFSAHLANWELAAVCAAAHGLDAAVLFRAPTNRFVAELIHETRSNSMVKLVPTGFQSVFAMAGMIERGGHVGMLVDQYYHEIHGAERVTFFGRSTPANPTLARLARQFDCPVYGVRIVRLPQNRFRVDLVGPVELPRDAEGRVDVGPATQKIMSIIEGWIREHPEQWLWLHRRWRD